MMAVVSTVRTFARLSSPKSSSGIKKALVPMLFAQNMSSQQLAPQTISKNLELYFCSDKKKHENNKRPLAVLFAWLMSKPKHIMKYGDFYREQGFDVLAVTISPTQLMWPTTGAQVIAGDVMNYLVNQDQYQNLLIHGFSVGGYLYGECLVKLLSDPAKYSRVKDLIAGQIFDSAVDFTHIPIGASKAMTNNPILRKVLESYLRYHMKTFYEQATRHYLRSSDTFHHNPIHTPSLFLFSKDDPVGTAEGNLKAIKQWENNMKVYVKCWESSPHVSHYQRHPSEYLEELAAYLERIDLLAVPLKTIEKYKKASKL